MKMIASKVLEQRTPGTIGWEIKMFLLSLCCRIVLNITLLCFTHTPPIIDWGAGSGEKMAEDRQSSLSFHEFPQDGAKQIADQLSLILRHRTARLNVNSEPDWKTRTNTDREPGRLSSNNILTIPASPPLSIHHASPPSSHRSSQPRQWKRHSDGDNSHWMVSIFSRMKKFVCFSSLWSLGIHFIITFFIFGVDQTWAQISPGYASQQHCKHIH